jgi:hypothetical protein
MIVFRLIMISHNYRVGAFRSTNAIVCVQRIRISIFKMGSFKDQLNFRLSRLSWGVLDFRSSFFNWFFKWCKWLRPFLRTSPWNLVLGTRRSPPLPRIRGDSRVGSLLGYLYSLRHIYCRYIRLCHSFMISEGIWQLICKTLQMYNPPNFQFGFTSAWI